MKTEKIQSITTKKEWQQPTLQVLSRGYGIEKSRTNIHENTAHYVTGTSAGVPYKKLVGSNANTTHITINGVAAGHPKSSFAS